MNGPYADAFAGPPTDDGVAAAAWRMSLALEPARAAYVEASEQPTLLEVLLASLGASEGDGVR